MMQTQKVPPVFETNVASNITIVADQEAFFADATTPTHPPHRWIQAKPESTDWLLAGAGFPGRCRVGSLRVWSGCLGVFEGVLG